MKRSMVAMMVVLMLGAGTGAATLSYSGSDLSSGDGTMTIKCTCPQAGDLWELDLVRSTANAGQGGRITRFDDLTDSGSFDYAGLGSYGMFHCNWIRNDGASYTQTFTEVTKTSSMYQYRVTSVTQYDEEDATETTYLYTLNASTSEGTQFTCERSFENISGVQLSTSGGDPAGLNTRMCTEMYVYDNNYTGDYLTAYASGVSTHKLSDTSDAIWKITDNIENRDANAMWGQAEVMDSTVTSGLGLVAGRTFKMTTDLDESSIGEMVLLHPTANVGLDFRVAYQSGWGQPNPVPVDYTADRDVTLDINICGGLVVDAEESSVTVSPSSLPADGMAMTTITITLRDASETLIPDKAEDIDISATDTGTDNVYGTVTEVSTGVYTCTLKSETAETKTITVTVDEVTELDDEPQVVFYGPATLSYSGNDISSADGTMTIKCSHAVNGDLWELDLVRHTANAGLGGRITRFDDLTDSGSFDYAGSGSLGMFHCNWIRNDGASYTLVFTEVTKTSSMYQYRITSVTQYNGEDATETTYLYTFNPAGTYGTQFTCERTFENTSGVALSTSGGDPAGLASRMPTEMFVYDNNYTGDYLTAYVSGVSTHKLSDTSDAIWRITDNIENRDGQAMWGRAEVMSSTVTNGLDLVAGRTFKMTTDLNESSIGQMVLLHPTANAGLDFRVAYSSGWGQPNPVPVDYTADRDVAMDVNISDGRPIGSLDATVSVGEVSGPMYLHANGSDEATITITLKDANGYLVTGEADDIEISATDTGTDNVYGTVVEVAYGVYEVTLTTETAEVKTITIEVGETTLEDQPQIEFGDTFTFHVDATDGNDTTGEGTAVKPWKTLSKLFDYLQSGDTALLYDGDYGELTITGKQEDEQIFTDWVTIKAADGEDDVDLENVEITGTYDNDDQAGTYDIYLKFEGLHIEDGVYIVGGRHWGLKDCLVERYGPYTGSVPNILKTAVNWRCTTDVTIEGCEITNTGCGVAGQGGHDVEVIGCHIHGGSHDGIRCVGWWNSLVEGNLIHDFDDTIDDASGLEWNRHCDLIHIFIAGSGLPNWQNHNVLFRNNTLYDAESQIIQINNYDNVRRNEMLVFENNVMGPGRAPMFNNGDPTNGIVFRNNSVIYFPEGRQYHTWLCENHLLRIDGDSTDVEIYNNILGSVGFDTGAEIDYFDYNIIQIDANLPVGVDYWRAPGKFTQLGVDPLYEDADDFTGELSSNSPAINAATRVFAPDAIYEYDIEATARDNRPDLGAWEYPNQTPAVEDEPTIYQDTKTTFLEDWDDGSYLDVDDWLQDENTQGLSWWYPSGDTYKYYIRYNESYLDDNSLWTGNGAASQTKNQWLISEQGEDWADYTFEFDVYNGYCQDGEGPLVLAIDEDNCYWIDISYNNGGNLVRIMDGTPSTLASDSDIEMSYVGPSPNGVRYRITVEHVTGPDGIKIEVDKGADDSVELSYTDTDEDAVEDFTAGGVGFHCESESLYYGARYDDIEVNVDEFDE